MQSDSTTPFVVKFVFGADVRRVQAEASAGVARLAELARSLFTRPNVSLAYIDDEGDEVALNDEPALAEALRLQRVTGASALRVVVKAVGECCESCGTRVADGPALDLAPLRQRLLAAVHGQIQYFKDQTGADPPERLTERFDRIQARFESRAQ